MCWALTQRIRDYLGDSTGEFCHQICLYSSCAINYTAQREVLQAPVLLSITLGLLVYHVGEVIQAGGKFSEKSSHLQP